MDPIALFCKSYDKDLLRAKRLAASIERHNHDCLPFVLCVPETQLELFQRELASYAVRWITDEQVLRATAEAIGDARVFDGFPPHLFQQLIKMEFWRLEQCRNYVILDSDAYFIRSFDRDEFLGADESPYTVIHECKDLLQWAARHRKNKIASDYEALCHRFKQLFGRRGPSYDFGPPPLIWSAALWRHFERHYLKPRRTHVVDLLASHPSEIQWYGEYLLASGVIPLRPREPLFKFYHYREQYIEALSLGEDERALSHNYLGVVIQSNWDRETDWPPPEAPHARRSRWRIFTRR